MAGAVLKTFGIGLIVLGILAVVGGIGAAATGFVAENGNQDRTLPDPDETKQNEALMLGGGVAAGLGVIGTVAGILFTGWGNGRREAVLMGRPVTSTTALAAAAAIGVGVIAGGVLLGGVVDPEGLESGVTFFPGSQDAADTGTPLRVQTEEGTVQGVGTPLLSANTAAGSENTIIPLDVAPEAGSARLEVVWDDGTPLTLILEARDGGAWTEVERDAGATPLVIDVTEAGTLERELRVRVFVEEGATAGQAFTFYASSFVEGIPSGYAAGERGAGT